MRLITIIVFGFQDVKLRKETYKVDTFWLCHYHWPCFSFDWAITNQFLYIFDCFSLSYHYMCDALGPSRRERQQRRNRQQRLRSTIHIQGSIHTDRQIHNRRRHSKTDTHVYTDTRKLQLMAIFLCFRFQPKTCEMMMNALITCLRGKAINTPTLVISQVHIRQQEFHMQRAVSKMKYLGTAIRCRPTVSACVNNVF